MASSEVQEMLDRNVPWVCFRLRAFSGTVIRYGTARHSKNSLSNSDVSCQNPCLMASGLLRMSQDFVGRKATSVTINATFVTSKVTSRSGYAQPSAGM
jgi:hypothetical protein